MSAINGILPLKLPTGQTVFIVGGPYRNYAQSGVRKFASGACLLEDEPKEFDVWLPIEDFQTPTEDQKEDVLVAVQEVLNYAITDGIVWVGCMGGWGRTGLFMSLLAKAAGQGDPVAYVREFYTPKAVETSDQKQYVADFDVEPIKEWLNAMVVIEETIESPQPEYTPEQQVLDAHPEIDPAAPFSIRLRRAWNILLGRGEPSF